MSGTAKERLTEIEHEQFPKITVEQLTAKNVGAVRKIFDNAFPDEAGDYEETYFTDLINKREKYIRREIYVARLQQPSAHELTESGSDPYIAFRWVNVAGEASGSEDGKGLAYVPYGGVDGNFRGKSVYPKISLETERLSQEHFGVHSFVNEVERPTEFQLTSETSNEDRIKINRIAFFQNKMGYEFIDPAYLETHRPGWDDQGSKRDEDHTEYILGYQSLNEQGPQVVKKDGKRYLSKTDVRKLFRGFMIFNDIEPGELESYTSYQLFMREVDQLEGDLVPLLPKVRPLQHDIPAPNSE